MDYVKALITDMQQDLLTLPRRKISSIFIGGGTPSLLSANAYKYLFKNLATELEFEQNMEITLEANPGTVESERFKGFREAGINRLSLGIQSFNPQHLKTLGRIHDDKQAHAAIITARESGFDNFNLDIMHGLPGQTAAEGLADLKQALEYDPAHLSWYQLTVEPNTVFYKTRPQLPDEDILAELEDGGLALLRSKGYERYEISAFSLPGRQSAHNLNYWLFGDYYGIGAGAHGKITLDDGQVCRTQKQRQPKDFLNPDKKFVANSEIIQSEQLIFEFMLNATRLRQLIPHDLFTQTTGLPFSMLADLLKKAEVAGFLEIFPQSWQLTDLGKRFTCDLQEIFLPG